MVKYYTADELRLHNCADDLWVSVFDNVYNLTGLVAENRGPLANPLIEAAGTSITHWFDAKTKDVKTFVDPVRQIIMPYTPQGRFIHVPPPDPRDKTPSVDLPWWKDSKFVIGKLTSRTRMIKVVNMVTRVEDVITICAEETIADIRERYLEYNAHSLSYTWKAVLRDEFVVLDMAKTLEENGIPDESDTFVDLNMDYDFYIPTLHIYFNDDLSEA